ncbi:m-phase inducer phosphatase [Tritrichomonas foetus]|uniref:M-phase inducer phosphatase n=1 Tax=Tritrichomonas foetus TaxID=1144522 RepID=A0A1J4KYP3_9EUKA|nr:m-phase inducer phosphatase [Tritrichomonas foetus]|eukprot:OHT16369.1 m-phase inducer phosphatase [Tritrichomonas foetus]
MYTRSRCNSEDLRSINVSHKIADEIPNETIRRHSMKHIPKIISVPHHQIINKYELADLVSNISINSYNCLVIFDSRYDYEYRSGRIISSFNPKSGVELCRIYSRFAERKTCFIFYCDKSMYRSKIMHSFLMGVLKGKDQDLFYKNSFILNSGFEDFIKNVPDLCVGSFIKKSDPRYVENGSLRRSMSRMRREFINYSKKDMESMKIYQEKRLSSNDADDFCNVCKNIIIPFMSKSD